MFFIDEVAIEENIAHAHFACDVVNCLGACCILPGGRGAPLDDSEIVEIERAFPIIKKYLPERNLKTIEHSGLFEGNPGSYSTSCVAKEDCVFVYYENMIARCSFEKAFNNGELPWLKPISCHLFPIRILHDFVVTLRYENISECLSAIECGNKSKIMLYDFLKDPLTRKFGNSWYNKFRYECQRRNSNSIV
jgi:hypothetical protein